MLRNKYLRIGGYVAFSFFALLLGLYATFPSDAVAQRLAHEITVNSDGEFTATIGDVDLYGLTGIEAEDIHLKVGNTDPPIPVTVESARARLNILPLLLFRLSFTASVQLPQGSIEAEFTRKDAEAFAFDIDVEDLSLSNPPVLASALGMPVNALISGSIEADIGSNPALATGKLDLTLRDGGVGPGTVKGFTLPSEMALGTIEMGIAVDQGKLEVTRFQQQAGERPPDLEIKNFDASITLRPQLDSSVLDACLAVRMNQNFLDKNPKFKTILDLAVVPPPMGPGLKKAPDGYLHASIGGTLGKPRPSSRLCTERRGREADESGDAVSAQAKERAERIAERAAERAERAAAARAQREAARVDRRTQRVGGDEPPTPGITSPQLPPTAAVPRPPFRPGQPVGQQMDPDEQRRQLMRKHVPPYVPGYGGARAGEDEGGEVAEQPTEGVPSEEISEVPEETPQEEVAPEEAPQGEAYEDEGGLDESETE